MQVTVDDRPAPQPLLWKKPLALLLYLLRSSRRTRSREHLVGLLWPDASEASAKHSLNEALSKLRRAGGDDSVESNGEQVTLGPQFRCDVDDFEAAMLRCDWEAAAALCTGELAEGLAVPGALEFDQWLEGERRHWRGQGVLALAYWAQQLLDRGHARAAVDAALRALALDPLSEPATRALMRARLLLGDRHGAVEAGRALTDRLSREFGVEPDKETLALIGRAAPDGRTPVAPWVDDNPRTPLVGRESELAALLGLLERTRALREGSLAIVMGEPGTGVSRLLQELAARARLSGNAVSRLVAVEADRDDPWSGVTGLAIGGLLDAAGLAAAPASSLGVLAARLVPWAERFAATAASDEPVDRAFSEVVAAAADEQPVLLVLDDAQRLDEDTLRALPRMLRRWRELPVLVVVGAAPLPERPPIDELRLSPGRDVPGIALELAPLTVSALRQLASAILPSYRPVELDRVVRRIVTDSAGVPLLALELLNAVSRGLELGGLGKAWPATSATLDDSLPGDVPDAIVAAVRVNFRRLSRGARDVLAAAAVLSDRVTAAQLARVTELTATEVEAALDELEWHNWLSAEGRGYSFVARLARRVIGDDMLTPGQRRRILERTGGGSQS